MRKELLLCSVLIALGCALSKKDEKEILSQFRERVQGNLTNPHMKTDFYLSKWLRATDYKIDDAVEMIFENLEWRQENDMDNILQHDYSDMEMDFPAYTDTHDKQGRPLAHILFGKWDVRAAAVQGKLPRLIKYACRIYELGETLLNKARDSGLNVSSVMVVIDFDEFNTVQHMCSSCISVFVAYMDCLDSHYPFLTEEFILINVPSKFKIMVRAASVVLRKDTRDRFHYLEDKSKWLPYLDERIDRDQRYTNAGGTREL